MKQGSPVRTVDPRSFGTWLSVRDVSGESGRKRRPGVPLPLALRGQAKDHGPTQSPAEQQPHPEDPTIQRSSLPDRFSSFSIPRIRKRKNGRPSSIVHPPRVVSGGGGCLGSGPSGSERIALSRWKGNGLRRVPQKCLVRWNFPRSAARLRFSNKLEGECRWEGSRRLPIV